MVITARRCTSWCLEAPARSFSGECQIAPFLQLGISLEFVILCFGNEFATKLQSFDWVRAELVEELIHLEFLWLSIHVVEYLHKWLAHAWWNDYIRCVNTARSLSPRPAILISSVWFRCFPEASACCETGLDSMVGSASSDLNRSFERILKLFFIVHDAGRHGSGTSDFPSNLQLGWVPLTSWVLPNIVPI